MVHGLRRRPKAIPPKYLYDANGSLLFDRICELEEYYPTRTELGILRDSIYEVEEVLGPRCLLVEYGSGSSLKTRVLLDHRDDWAAYVPIDISLEHLRASAEALRERYPGLDVLPVCADYTAEFELPSPKQAPEHTVVFFPGSTIGNLEPPEAEAFLKQIAGVCRHGGGILIGVDLHKDADILEAAYDDREGVSARFALNLLDRMNRELGANFQSEAFAYRAHYDEAEQRVVMAIESLESQVVTIGDQRFELEKGEQIRTEYSYKYTIPGFAELAGRAGLSVERVWLDPRGWFSLQYLVV